MKKKIIMDATLLTFGSGGAKFTIRDAVSGLSILGNTGSGKSSGSAAAFARHYLKAGFGGLVLMVKRDDKNEWLKYCKETGREKDLVIVEPGGQHRFNFLEYISKQTGNERPITDNIVEVINTVIRAEEDRKGQSDDAFWESALTTLLGMVVDLLLIAYGKIDIDTFYNVVQSLPRPTDDPSVPFDPQKQNAAFQIAFELAKEKTNAKIKQWWESLSETNKAKLNCRELYENALFEAVPDVRLSNFLVEYFWSSFRFLSPKTRSIVEFIFNGFAYTLMRDPIYSLFCKGESTVKPEDCFDGKIILLNLPTKIYNKAGRDCQRLFKSIWQRSVERRIIDDTSLPIFLWSDEAQNTVIESDSDFLATARSSRIATVFISQGLPSYFSTMGGEKARYRVTSMLANLSTKIFHANTCVETNRWASDLIGENEKTKSSFSYSYDTKKVGHGQSETTELKKDVLPSEFVKFKNGGPLNNNRVQAIIHKQGTPYPNGANFKRITFTQI